MPPSIITAAKQKQLETRMLELGVYEEDLVEKFIRGSGRGGQKINKTSSCVYLHHKPSGIEVKCQQERSQALNRFFARRELCEQLAERTAGEKSKRRQEQERVRRQKRRRSRKAKEKVLEKKRAQAQKKSRRKPVKPED